jgi:hypothetical protein
MKIQLFKASPKPAASIRVATAMVKDRIGKDSAFIEDQFSLLKKRRIAPPVRLLKL